MKIASFMVQKVITGSPNEGLRQAFFKMRAHRVRHLPVVDHHMNLLGIVSDRDLRRPNWVDEAPDVAHYYNLDDDLELKDVMNSNVVTVYAYEPLQRAVHLLREHRVGALPVLNRDDKVAGIISANDLLGVLEELLDEHHRIKGYD